MLPTPLSARKGSSSLWRLTQGTRPMTFRIRARMGSFAATAVLLAVLPASLWAQSVQTKQYDDGGVYEGGFLNGRQHGIGTYRLPNGYEYTGEWFEGEIRGQGVARVVEVLIVGTRQQSEVLPTLDEIR